MQVEWFTFFFQSDLWKFSVNLVSRHEYEISPVVGYVTLETHTTNPSSNSLRPFI